MKATWLATMAVFSVFSLGTAACASTAQEVRPQTALHNCTPQGPVVVNPDSRLHGFATSDEGQPRVVTPGTLELEGRGVAPSAGGTVAHSAGNTISHGDATCF
jgi:hypothetical protein